jgi:hypothetical protein
MKKFVVTLVGIALGGLLFVHLEIEAVKIGYTIQKQELLRTQLIDRARALKYNIAKMKAPGNLERKLSAQRVMLESPKTWQTLVITEAQRVSPNIRLGSPMLQGLPLAKFFIGTAQAEAKEGAGR